jgi:hypothetical protein
MDKITKITIREIISELEGFRDTLHEIASDEDGTESGSKVFCAAESIDEAINFLEDV